MSQYSSVGKTVLIVHNFYSKKSHSGENRVVEDDRNLLINNVYHLETFNYFSDDILADKIRSLIGIVFLFWNPFVFFKFRKKLRECRPDIVHIHNTFPFISPSIFWALASYRVVFTLHNFRIFCAEGTLMRNNRPCELCLSQGSWWLPVKYKCYKNSFIKSALVSWLIFFNRMAGTYSRHVDIFLTLTDFQKKKMLLAGLAATNLLRGQNTFIANEQLSAVTSKRKKSVVFIGRLSEEKGVKYLIDAWKNFDCEDSELLIVGDGPDAQKLKKQSLGCKSVQFLGTQSRRNTLSIMASANLIVVPSICYEGYPVVIAEAFSLGVPVAASSIGPLPEILDDGAYGFYSHLKILHR